MFALRYSLFRLPPGTRQFINDSHPTQMAREIGPMLKVNSTVADRLARLVYETRGSRPAATVLSTIRDIHDNRFPTQPITPEIIAQIQRAVDESHPLEANTATESPTHANPESVTLSFSGR